MSTTKMNYEELKSYIPQNGNEENYALLTHYLMMRNGESKNAKKNELIQEFFFEEDKIIAAEELYRTRAIPFRAQNEPSFTFVDLFAGIGGFRLAMQANGGECVFSSEWDKAAKQTYYENYGEVPFGDISKKEIKEAMPTYFDVLCAGFPCQPFSNAGLKKGIEDTRGTLFYHIAEILDKHKPKAVLLENVRGLISNDSGKTFQTILRTIMGMGYSCNISFDQLETLSLAKLKQEASKMVLSAKDYGVPQNRPRIYIVLWKNDLKLVHFNYPKALNKQTSVKTVLEKTVSDSYTISDKLWAGHQRRRVINAQKGNGFGYCLFNGDSKYTSTLSRRYYKDGSEILIEQKGKNPRKLTPREATNLQGFPSNFIINKSNVEAYKQAGNSIAVPVVKIISKEIKKQNLEI